MAQFKYSSAWERIQYSHVWRVLCVFNAYLFSVDLMQLYAQYMFTQLHQRHIVKDKAT